MSGKDYGASRALKQISLSHHAAKVLHVHLKSWSLLVARVKFEPESSSSYESSSSQVNNLFLFLFFLLIVILAFMMMCQW